VCSSLSPNPSAFHFLYRLILLWFCGRHWFSRGRVFLPIHFLSAAFFSCLLGILFAVECISWDFCLRCQSDLRQCVLHHQGLPLRDPCSHEQVRRALHRSVFPVRFSVIILIQPEQAPGGFYSFLRLGSQSPLFDCFPGPIRSSKATPLFAVECQDLVLIGTKPFPNSVLADFSVRSGEPMRQPGARALELGLHDQLPV
jgi:hypothetical protein